MFKRLMALIALSLGSAAAYACPSGMTVFKAGSGNKPTICRFTSNEVLGQTITLTPSFEYILTAGTGSGGQPLNGTYIGGDNNNKSTLIILPGVKIYANESTFLSISRGSEIRAEGSASAPIVFTSSKSEATRGLWGGLIISGNAPVNSPEVDGSCGGVVFEGVKERKICFGGSNPTESSGTLKYVRIEYGGYPIAPDKEINGVTFNGVGNGTTVDYVQAYMIADDCFEMFGGTVDAKHLVCTGGDDDGIDTDMGYNGRIQFAVVQYANDKGDSAFEWDNHSKELDALPRNTPTVSNVTAVGGPVSGYGMMIRKGSSGVIMNSIFSGFTKGCVDIDDDQTFAHGSLSISSTVINCTKPFEAEEADKWSIEAWFLGGNANSVRDPQLNGYVLQTSSPLRSQAVAPSDWFFDEVSYIGAVDPSNDWTAGWVKALPANLLP